MLIQKQTFTCSVQMKNFCISAIVSNINTKKHTFHNVMKEEVEEKTLTIVGKCSKATADTTETK